MTVSRLLIFSLGATLTVGTAARADPPKAAVFDFQLANVGIQGLLVRETNTEVITFYERLGCEVTPRTVMAKWLVEAP